MLLDYDFTKYPWIILNSRQLCDFEMITNGAYAPLKGFMTKHQYNSCLKDMTIDGKMLFPIPITLSINLKTKEELKHSSFLTLKHITGLPLGILKVESIFEYDLQKEASSCIGCYDLNHPYTKIQYKEVQEGYTYYIGGDIVYFKQVPHYDFIEYRLSPEETKNFIKRNGWKKIIGFQTRNPMHRSHYELTKYALKQAGNGNSAKLLLTPCVGITQDCDIDYFTRVKCYIELLKYYDINTVKLNLINFGMRMYGPRSALFHAIIRKNYGCTHFVVGRDHASPSFKKENGEDFFAVYDAQALLLQYADRIGIKPIVSKMIVYAVPKLKPNTLGSYELVDEVDTEQYDIKQISGTQQRYILQNGHDLPDWFTFPLIKKQLQKYFLPPRNQGFCVYFYGLSGSGKSYISHFLKSKLQEITDRVITLLDGDIIRTHISKGLGFSKLDRSINVRRIGYVASEIVKHGGICLVSNIAPYQEDRKHNKELIEIYGNYIEVLVDTNLSVCEERDCKGLYKLAREGVIEEFTGISDPFEKHLQEDLAIDGTCSLEENLDKLLLLLRSRSLL